MTQRGSAAGRFDPLNCTLDHYRSDDPGMQRCLELALVAARTDLPILILGESGTGKTLLARAIHNSSGRGSGAFVSFSGAALSDTLMDSQLFGHEKGAFTGACKTMRGKFEQADKGTLFIDEIADMSAEAQAKILRAVEYGEFERLGSEELLVAEVRVIAATHLPLEALTESGHFRKDLLFRLKAMTINVPPLRERPSDLRALLVSEAGVACDKLGKGVTAVSKHALDLLLSYGWPGNLRELKSVIHVAVAMTDDDVIRREDILLEPHESAAPEREQEATANPHPVEDMSLRTMEKRHIQWVLEKLNGNKRRAAKKLGISRSTLDRKLKL